MQRRQFLLRCGCASLAPLTLADCGGSDNAPHCTTLDLRVGGPERPVLRYARLQRLPGEPLMTLAPPGLQPRATRTQTRQALAALVQITDLHIIEADTPARLPFARQYEWAIPEQAPARLGYKFIGSFRAQEALGMHVLNAMVERINALARRSPVTGRPLDCVVSTGDNSDSRGWHELQQYLRLLGGGKVHPHAADQAHAGLQSQRTDIPDAIQQAFWHPDPPAAGRSLDRWKTQWGYPEYPGLLDAAMRPFEAPGLAVPWYSGFGNHDGIDLGIYEAGSGPARLMAHFATGEAFPVGVRPGVQPLQFIQAVEALAPDAPLQPVLDMLLTVPITASPERRSFTRAEFAQAHLDLPSRAGPPGHGYTPQHVAQDRLYFSFMLAPGVKGIMLDTTCLRGGEEGWLDGAQRDWLLAELTAAHASYFDSTDGARLVRTDHADQLCVVFSHHSSRSMHNAGGRDPQGRPYLDIDPQTGAGYPHPQLRAGVDYINGDALVALLHRFPNVVAWVNGHTHANRITLHEAPAGRPQSGFWEINTASHIDFPQQARVLELADNGDGTLSLFSVLLDHSDPADVPPPGESAQRLPPRALAALALELSANDQRSRASEDRSGAAHDRNVEMLLRRPFPR